MNNLCCYYAHTMVSYNSTIERDDIELLEKLGFYVDNPNQEKYRHELYEHTKNLGAASVMDYFCSLVEKNDLLAFRALPDGNIPSGIAKEVNHAYLLGIPVIELPCSIEKRSMNYDNTKEYFKELGHYKI